MRNPIVGILLLLFLAPLQAATPLVDAEWLLANLSKPNLVVLDLQPKPTYVRFHVPGAVNSAYADWRKPDAGKIPGMIPSIGLLEQLIGGLGIDNQTHVVLVITGQSVGEMASAARVYWTFKALGHDQVSILDGGLVAYAETGKGSLESKINVPEPKMFKANARAEYLVTAEQLKALLGSGISLVDSRSSGEYMGLQYGGGKERPGTIPGAVNLPYDWLTVNGGARLQSIGNLKRIYAQVGLSPQDEQISFCHTGHRTALNWFVAHELFGNDKARMYDGSMAAWAVDSSLPIERKIALD